MGADNLHNASESIADRSMATATRELVHGGTLLLRSDRCHITTVNAGACCAQQGEATAGGTILEWQTEDFHAAVS